MTKKPLKVHKFLVAHANLKILRKVRKNLRGRTTAHFRNSVSKVTPVPSQELSCIDNKIWRTRMNESINQSVNEEVVFRTAPATPGLLNIYYYF